MIVKLIACLLLIVPLHAQERSSDVYSNGKIRSDGLKNGTQKVGEWKYFYPDGTRMAVENYKDGHLDRDVSFFS